MFYVDTSVLVSALTLEPATLASRRWLSTHTDCAISPWVVTEFSSTMSAKVAGGVVTDVLREQAQKSFEQLVRQQCVMCPVQDAHFLMAAKLCDSEISIRAGDALHLAVAASRGLGMVSRDRRLIEAAAFLGLRAVNPDEFDARPK